MPSAIDLAVQAITDAADAREKAKKDRADAAKGRSYLSPFLRKSSMINKLGKNPILTTAYKDNAKVTDAVNAAIIAEATRGGGGGKRKYKKRKGTYKKKRSYKKKKRSYD